MIDEEAKYLEAWKRMRRRGWIAITFAVPGALYTLLWLSGVITFDRHKLLQPYVLPMVIPILIANWYFSTRCPRCGKSFFHTWRRTEPFARNCVHCGLRHGASSCGVDDSRAPAAVTHIPRS